ncbi:hypothetical protein [Metabacillus niabensis]|uniref:hypothetical protein n=1 Tax=Metabacillus niabensis TaxID=324854 RepID=UPI0039A23BBA
MSIHRVPRKAFQLQEVSINDENIGLVFSDQFNNILDKKTAIKYVEMLTVAYNSKGIDEFIKNHNEESQFLQELEYNLNTSYLKYSRNGEGKYIIKKQTEFNEKTFRNDLEKPWAFKCATCNKKVSSETALHYYSVQNPTTTYSDTERTCSNSCGFIVWKEKLLNWINENGYGEFVFIED